MFHEGVSYAAKHGMLFEETSAKTGSNVQKAFTDLLTSKLRAVHFQRISLIVFLRM